MALEYIRQFRVLNFIETHTVFVGSLQAPQGNTYVSATPLASADRGGGDAAAATRVEDEVLGKMPAEGNMMSRLIVVRDRRIWGQKEIIDCTIPFSSVRNLG